MNRGRMQRMVTVLVVVAGWIALVADQPPSSSVDSEEFTGTVILTPERPEVRVPFELEFTRDEDDPGGSGLMIDVVHSWAGVAGSRLPVTIESPTGSIDVDSRYYVCRDCQGPGELVIKWPRWESEGSVVVTWTASAALSYDTNEPPPGASVAFDMDVPPVEIEESRLHPVDALEQPLQREMLSLAGTPDPADRLRIAWPGWRADPKQVPNAVLVRWADESFVLAPGLAVEIAVTELCAPGCEAELTYFLDQEPSAYLGPWEFIAPLTAAFLGGGAAEVILNNVPVPSVSSPSIEHEVSAPPDPETETFTLSIVTDAIDDEIVPVAKLRYTVTADESVPWTDHGQIATRVSEHSVAWVRSEGPQGQSSTSLPLECDQDECRAEVSIVLESELAETAALLLELDVEVFHPDIAGHQVLATLSESS